MVNQSIVNYLKEGKKRGFSVDRLRKELVGHGFDVKEVDEAIMSLDNLPKTQNNINIQMQKPVQIVKPANSITNSNKTEQVELKTNQKKKSGKGLIIFLSLVLFLLICILIALILFREKIFSIL